jgi:hypothetical protein
MKRDGNSLKNLIGWSLLAAPLLLLADRPADRTPTTPDAPITSALAAGGKEAGKRAGPGNNEDKWQEVEAFMLEHSKHKLEAYRKLPPAAQAQVRAQLIARYNELGRLSNNRLHELEVKRIEIEDDLFAALLAERGRPHGQGEYSQPYLDAVRSLVLNRMDERAARLDDLKAMVKEDESIRYNQDELKARVRKQAQVIEKNGLGGAAQVTRRRIPGQPATAESEDDVLPANP